MHHPWRRFRDLAEWRLDITLLPDGVAAETHWPTRTVRLSSRLQTQAERRSAITHETLHIERGPVPEDGWLAAREELAVEVEAARRLIPLEALGEALAWSDHMCEVADELWVDEELVQVRLACLQPSERRYLRRRLSADEGET